ncbi:MAG: S-layer family protein, partial [Cyanobacteriota bacterium]
MTADTLTLINGAQISSITQGQGNAGNININTPILQLNNGAINASTFSNAQGGNINISAEESVNLTGSVFIFNDVVSRQEHDPASISISAASFASGRAGNITLNTGQLQLQDRALLGVSSFETGDAGTLRVNASDIRLDNQSIIDALTQSGEGGNINLQAHNSLQLRRNSSITTNAIGTATGGNININTGTLAALENSDISANSQQAQGGTVTINAQAIFGSVFRSRDELERLLNTTDPLLLNPSRLPSSDITATGANSSLSGTVTITTPDIDPTSGLLQLPETPVDATQLVASTCRRGKNQSEFTVTGRGGLPPNPYEAIA